jgi:hypothetical protein
VVEDRADIIFEVRDATDFHPSGSRPWVEELPPADAGSWAGRSSRRKQRAIYRLAFIASKFRIAEEPEPFILEINLTAEPWTVRDVTDLVDLEGAQARAQRATEKRERTDKAAAALVQEIERRAKAGKPPMAKRRDGEGFLMQQGLKRLEARECLDIRNGTDWTLTPLDGRTVLVLPVGYRKEESGHVLPITDPAKTEAITDVECGRPVSMHAATFDEAEVCKNDTFNKRGNVAETTTFIPPSEKKSEPLDDSEVL